MKKHVLTSRPMELKVCIKDASPYVCVIKPEMIVLSLYEKQKS